MSVSYMVPHLKFCMGKIYVEIRKLKKTVWFLTNIWELRKAFNPTFFVGFPVQCRLKLKTFLYVRKTNRKGVIILPSSPHFMQNRVD